MGDNTDDGSTLTAEPDEGGDRVANSEDQARDTDDIVDNPSEAPETASPAGDSPGGYVRYGVDGARQLPDTDDPDFSDPGWYLNRELSELSFQKRVLHEARDERTPLLERIRFLGLVTKNIDEFCMKRIGGLKQLMAGEVSDLTPDGRTPTEQWRLALETLESFFDRQDACYRHIVEERLPAIGIELVEPSDLSARDQAAFRSYFEAEILPTLTPLTFDPAHPFPFISNLSLSLAVQTRREGEDAKFSRVKIPENQPRLLHVGNILGNSGMNVDEDTERSAKSRESAAATTPESGTDQFIFIEDLVAANLDLLFPNLEILDWSTFRVTRNAEVRRNEEVAEGLIEMIEGVLRDRRFATVVRLEVSEDMPQSIRELLMQQLDLDDREVFEREPPLDLRDLSRLASLDRPDHSVEPWTPQPHPRFAAATNEDTDPTVFDIIQDDDVLVHHPYESFEKTVQALLKAAARDENVLAIKAAIYRTSRDSQVIESLIEAARNGKQVAVMVELKARFDEENNLRWVERLEEEGIHVAYGTIGLKTHSKTALVVRREADGVQLYSHVGTGNYHAETAKGYVDLGLLTNDPDVGHDLTRLFNFFTGHSRHEAYRKLLVAPETLRNELTNRIRTAAQAAQDGDDARITAKMNALEDPEIVRALYRAAAAGVDIELIVRDICRLRPGIPGVTDTVTVRSFVGRFLEHSRVFRFETGGQTEYFIGSADWMTRNLDRRVEAVVPIEDPEIQAELDDILSLYLEDNRRAWTLNPDGSYVQCTPPDSGPTVDVQAALMSRASTRSNETHDRDVD